MAGKKRKAISEESSNDETSSKSKSRSRKQTLSSKLAALEEERHERFWLMKSEPESRIENGHEMKFGVDDLKSCKDQTTHWDGVRNFEARNHMRSMRVGEQAFFYHSNCKNPGIVATMRVCREAYVDHTQFDPNDAHYDSKCRDKNNPKWFMVDVKFERELKRFIPLSELKRYYNEHKSMGVKGPLANLSLFTRSRLSVQSISKQEWDFIIDLENKPPLV